MDYMSISSVIIDGDTIYHYGNHFRGQDCAQAPEGRRHALEEVRGQGRRST